MKIKAKFIGKNRYLGYFIDTYYDLTVEQVFNTQNISVKTFYNKAHTYESLQDFLQDWTNIKTQ